MRNVGATPLQVLPLLKTTLRIDGSTVAALNTADFPLNDRRFFEGARIYPFHQLVGYINFPYATAADVDASIAFTIGPIVQDGAQGPLTATVGPIRLPAW